MALTPWMLDLILAGIAVEAALGTALLVRFRRRWLVRPFLWFLLSGAALMAALRTVLAAAGEPVALTGPAPAFMLASLLGHLLAIVGVLRATPKDENA